MSVEVEAAERYDAVWREVALAMLGFSLLGLRPETGQELAAESARARDAFAVALHAVEATAPPNADPVREPLLNLCREALEAMSGVVGGHEQEDGTRIETALRRLDDVMQRIRLLGMSARQPQGAVRVRQRIAVKGDATFVGKVLAHFATLEVTPRARALLDAIDQTAFQLMIVESPMDEAVLDRGMNAAWALPGELMRADGAPGGGSPTLIFYNPERWRVGPILDDAPGQRVWDTRPPEAGLFRMLFHAWRSLTGTTPPGEGVDAQGARRPLAELEALRYELAFREELARSRVAMPGLS